MSEALKRQFSFPFNGSDAKEFLDRLEGYRDYIHDVYVGLPAIENYFITKTKNISEDYDDQCERFLNETKDSWLKRYVPINADYSRLTPEEMDDLIEAVIGQIDRFAIDGIICTEIYMAEHIHQKRPGVKINTSCNGFHWSIPQLRTWERRAGIDLVNPPREAGRNLGFLKKLHEGGFRIKLLVNEACTLRCPYLSNFCFGRHKYTGSCFAMMEYDEVNRLQSCMVFPKWLKYLDEYVDVYKITGRYLPADHIFGLLDLYIKGEDCSFKDMFVSHDEELDFPTSMIPDRLMFCNYEQCGHGCDLCETTIKTGLRYAAEKNGKAG